MIAPMSENPPEDEPGTEPTTGDDSTALVLSGSPSNLVAIRFPGAGPDGADLTITRDGTPVPSADAESLTTQAADLGVTLTQKEN